MTGAEELFYARGELSVEQIQAEIARFWQDLDNPGGSALDADLRAAGLDRSALAGVDRENAITVRAGTSGVDPTTAVLISFAGTLGESHNQGPVEEGRASVHPAATG